MKEQEIADIYTLPPIQQGILFHSLYTPASDVYFEQFSWSIHADLDIAAFGQAWQTVVDRHPILRTSFFWEDMDEPLQVVRRRVTLPLEHHDWSMLLSEEQQARLAALLVEDRRRGFDLNVAPLMRVSLVLLNPTTYQIVWSYHHLLLDGWSISLLLDEVFLCYEAYCRGEVPRLSERRPYRDYITWLRQKDLAGAEAFWRRTLRGFSAPTPLRIDHAAVDGPTADEDYAEQRAEFTAATTEALQSLARQHRLTLNTLFQGAWALLLSCYSGEEEVVFGVTVSGRPLDLRGSQAMIGLFINTLPVRVRVEPQADLLDWLNALQDQQVELREYEYSSLFEVQGWSEVPRSVPLFESIVVFENLAVNAFWHPKTTLIFQRTNFPLTLIVHPGPTLLVRAGYDPRRFDAAMIARLLHHLQVAFQHLIAHPRQHLMDFSLLAEAERSQLLVDGNATHMAYPQDVCVHELFATQAARTPDAIAVAFDRGQESGVRGQGSGRQGDKESGVRSQEATTPLGPPAGGGTEGGRAWASETLSPQSSVLSPEHLTYRELNERANRLAHHLRALNVGPEVVVAVCMERSIELIVALLGILKTGGAYLPLDPSYPVERLAFMLEDSQAAVLLTQRRLSTRLPAHRAQVVCVDDADQVSPTEADSSFILHPSSFGDNLAYVIYTSGSTGTPKGVLGLHRGMVNRFHWMWATYPFAAGEVCCQKTALSFVDSVWEVLGPLPQGVPLVVIPDELFKDLPRFVQTLAVTRVSRIVLVPTLLDVLLEMFPDLDQRLPALTYWICSGEALSAELCERFHARMPARILLNLYGSSEVAADTTWHDTRTGPIGMHVPIGRPIANMQVYVLDRALRPVPVGVPGELHVGGVGLARGYHRRPDLTAERFIPNPFWGMADGGWGMGTRLPSPIPHPPSPGTRLYRTGDLARYRDDGTLEFLGRVDHQVKVRGFRIEPGEIEAALARVKAVRQAVVVTHPDADGDLRLVAYIVPISDDRPPVRGDSGQATTDHPPGADADAGRPGDQETSQPSALSPPPSAGSASFVDELRQVLQAQLPAYMIPATFVVLDTLPLNPSGKIDRRALPKPDGVQPELAANFVPPRTELERMIAEIWQAFLHVDKVGIYDNFFELGGHSLMLLRMHSKLQGQIERELALIDLFRYPTIHLLATHLSQDTMATAATPDEGLSAKIEAGKNRLAQQRQHRQRALKPPRGSQ